MELFRNLKFRYKLMLSYLILIIIPITALGLYAYLQARTYLFNQVKTSLSESINQIAGKISNEFEAYTTIIHFLDFNNQMNSMFSVQDINYYQRYLDVTQIMNPLFETVMHINPHFNQLCVYTDNPFVSVSSQPGSFVRSADEIRDQIWFEEVQSDNQIHWIVENEEIKAYVRFINYVKEQPLNVLSVTIDYEKAFAINMSSTDNYLVFVADEENQIIFSENFLDNITVENVSERAVGAQSGEITVEGTKFLLLRNEIAGMDWFLYYCRPVSTITIDANEIAFATVVIIISCLFVLVIMILLFSRAFEKRILRLKLKMKMVEEGDLQIRVADESRDEIGDLGNSFGRMLDRINLLIQENIKHEAAEKDAELKALQAQITPHFLYNALSLINWKAILIDAHDISHFTSHLSRFYRTVLNSGKNMISIHDEINNIKSYIEIQLAFHKSSFDVRYDINEEIYKYVMINMILQPVVENAIEHGIELKADGRGEIVISGFFEENHIVFTVQDNGPGMSESDIEDVFRQNNEKYGLGNVKQRLHLFFGGDSEITLTNAYPGFVTKIVIPRRREEEMNHGKGTDMRS